MYGRIWGEVIPMYCELGQIAAMIDVFVAKNDDINVQALIDNIWALRNDKDLIFRGGEEVIIEGVGASFGDADVIVEVKTKLTTESGTHPTWRIAKFVEKVFNLKTVTRTKTQILVHDPNHDMRRQGARAG